MVRAALAAVDAGGLVTRTLADARVAAALRDAAAVDVIAAGKGAGPMLAAFLEAVPRPVRHAVGMAAQPAPRLPAGARWHETTHPVPDGRSVDAAGHALQLAGAADPRDLLVVLLSGGASSIMAMPAGGVTLDDKQKTSKLLLSLGAEIHDLNTVRKHLSGIKGGQLAAANRGRTLTLALSDVVGDDLSFIGSGPTVPDPTTYADALALLDAYGGRDRYPQAVVWRLTRGAAGEIAETPKPGDRRLERSDASVIGSIRTAMDGARRVAESLGYTVVTIDEPVVGEARDAARSLRDLVGRVLRDPANQSSRAPGTPLCVIGGGETTVKSSGTGKGGRNQEFALALARDLSALGVSAAAASVGTDGVDGPTDAAGAIVDSATLKRAAAAGVGDVDRYLNEHNSYLFFDQLGDLIRTGPTGTNVGDLQVILVQSEQRTAGSRQ